MLRYWTKEEEEELKSYKGVNIRSHPHIVGQAQVLQITLTMALSYSSVMTRTAP